MEERGSKLIGLSNKRQITAVLCGNLLGEFLSLFTKAKPIDVILPLFSQLDGT